LTAARRVTIALLASILVVASGGADAWTGAGGGAPPHRAANPLYIPSRGVIGFGFGFGPWWGPYDSYAPPAYAYPPPVYSVPPPPPITGTAPPSAAGPASGECRQFESTVIVDGQPRVTRGFACQQPDGTWRMMQ
jgi:hypothetical protein